MTGYVYKITNKVNNKVYIGISNQSNVSLRWSDHLRADTDSLIGRAIKTYGVESFTFEVLDHLNYLSTSQIREVEQFYIKEYNSVENGYNQINSIAQEREFDLSSIPELAKAGLWGFRDITYTGTNENNNKIKSFWPSLTKSDTNILDKMITSSLFNNERGKYYVPLWRIFESRRQRFVVITFYGNDYVLETTEAVKSLLRAINNYGEFVEDYEDSTLYEITFLNESRNIYVKNVLYFEDEVNHCEPISDIQNIWKVEIE